jgi:hypothetical protein
MTHCKLFRRRALYPSFTHERVMHVSHDRQFHLTKVSGIEKRCAVFRN